MQRSPIQVLYKAVYDSNIAEINRLLNENADLINQSLPMGPILNLAVGRGNTEVIKILIEKGAKINTADKDGFTPLHEAVVKKQYASMQILLDKGADPKAENNMGSTPIDFAQGDKTMLTLLNSKLTNEDIQAKLEADEKIKEANDQTTDYMYHSYSAPPYMTDQDWILDRMKNAGYLKPNSPDESLGVCFGFGNMGGAAFLVGELDQFNARNQLIQSIPVDEMGKRIQEARAKERRVYEETKFELYGNRSDLSPQERKTLKERIEHKAENDQAFKEARLLQEIPAFFESTELIHQSMLHKDFFRPSQALHVADANPAFAHVSSHKLESVGGIASITRFTGIYTQNELINYFKSMRQQFRQPPPLTDPVTLSISTANHAIAIGYDPKADRWMYIDANKTPPTPYHSNENIATTVMGALFSKNEVAFTTEIFTTGNQQPVVSQRIKTWQASATFQALHDVTKPGADKKDANGGTWLHLAARMGMEEVVKDLLTKGHADPNQEVDYSAKAKVTPLKDAAVGDHAGVVKALLEAGAIDKPDDKNLTQLFYAAAYGKTQLVKTFLEHGGDANFTDKDGYSLLYYAIANGHPETALVLLENNADPNKMVEGKTLTELAQQKGMDDVYNYILSTHPASVSSPETKVEPTSKPSYTVECFFSDGTKSRFSAEVLPMILREISLANPTIASPSGMRVRISTPDSESEFILKRTSSPTTYELKALSNDPFLNQKIGREFTAMIHEDEPTAKVKVVTDNSLQFNEINGINNKKGFIDALVRNVSNRKEVNRLLTAQDIDSLQELREYFREYIKEQSTSSAEYKDNMTKLNSDLVQVLAHKNELSARTPEINKLGDQFNKEVKEIVSGKLKALQNQAAKNLILNELNSIEAAIKLGRIKTLDEAKGRLSILLIDQANKVPKSTQTTKQKLAGIIKKHEDDNSILKSLSRSIAPATHDTKYKI